VDIPLRMLNNLTHLILVDIHRTRWVKLFSNLSGIATRTRWVTLFSIEVDLIM
jgi:hypothetical protein